MYKTLHKKQGSVTVQLRFARSSVTFCAKRDKIYVKNSGSEFPDDLLENLRTHKIREQGLGIALLNIEERIQLMFGQQYGLHFYNENDFAVVKMEIPYVKDDYRG